VHRDKVARTNKPQQSGDRDEHRLRAKRRHHTRRSRTILELLALGDLVELLVLREGGREADTGLFALHDLFVLARDLRRQNTSRLVVALASERHHEVAKTHRSTDLKTMQLTVRENPQRVQLAATLTHSATMLNEPAPRSSNSARAIRVASHERHRHLEDVEYHQHRQSPPGCAAMPARRHH
jgi:hypothetical protein